MVVNVFVTASIFFRENRDDFVRRLVCTPVIYNHAIRRFTGNDNPLPGIVTRATSKGVTEVE